MFLTYTALTLRILANPIANAFQKKISQRNSAITSNFYTYLILSIAALPFALKTDWSKYNSELYIYALIAGFLCATGTACLIKALQSGELSVLGPINSYKSIIGMISALILLHEIPPFIGIFGMILIILGSRFIFETTKEGFSPQLFKRKDIQLRFLALLLTGIEAAFLKKVIVLSSPVISFYLWCFTGCLFAFILTVLIHKKLEPVQKSTLSMYFTVAISLFTMQLSTNIVFDKMDVGFALALFQLSTLVNLFLGYKMFHEKNITTKLIGTVIMIVGSILIILNA